MSEPADSERAVIELVVAMVDALAPLAQVEIVRALDLRLADEPTACERRLTELGPLSALLDERARRAGMTPPGRAPRAWRRAAISATRSFPRPTTTPRARPARRAASS